MRADDFVTGDSARGAGQSSLVGTETTNAVNTGLVGSATAIAKNMVIGGTVVTGGRGKIVVTGTGMDSEMGKIAGLLLRQQQGQTVPAAQQQIRDRGGRSHAESAQAPQLGRPGDEIRRLHQQQQRRRQTGPEGPAGKQPGIIKGDAAGKDENGRRQLAQACLKRQKQKGPRTAAQHAAKPRQARACRRRQSQGQRGAQAAEAACCQQARQGRPAQVTWNLEAVKKAITPGTRLVHIETPDNPTDGISDIEAIAKIAHENGAVLSVDNTFASPLNQRPLDLGADFVVESLTKYINGHGDAQGGAIISNDLAAMDRIRYEAQVNVGSVISPFNAWQIFRGAVTFPLRMERINASTQKIAEWLEQRQNVTFVSYPGLASHPGHELAKKQMKHGFGGVISFGIAADDKAVERFCAALKVVTFAVSLGHDESLIFPQPSYDERINLYPEKFRKGFIRFSIGLEDPDDIIGDLDQALKAIGL